MVIRNKRFTPDNITELSKCEIFVFGSNIHGQHHGGAARLAYEKFGAEWGKGVGLYGKTYAIPTMFQSVDEIRPYVDDFLVFARQHPNLRFLLTRIGCGIAGFKDSEIAPLFLKILDIPNITIPKEWLPILLKLGEKTGFDPNKRNEAPKVIDEEVLIVLCDKYSYEIGAGINVKLPKIKIRYVIETNKFGCAYFGDFFFHNNELYVWHKDDSFESRHSQQIVEEVFGDECKNRGYAVKHIFAGVRTPFKDADGESIYTGDVIWLSNKNQNFDDRVSPVDFLSVGAFINENASVYTFILDNHHYPLWEALNNEHLLKRVGTVFYYLNDEGDRWRLNSYVSSFNNGWYTSNEEKMFTVLMSRYTPNFQLEAYKYMILDFLNKRFDWKKLTPM